MKDFSERTQACFPAVFRLSLDTDMGDLDRQDVPRRDQAVKALGKELASCLDGSGYGGEPVVGPPRIRRWLATQTCDDFAREAFRARECFVLQVVLEEAGLPVPKPGAAPPKKKAPRADALSPGSPSVPPDGLYQASHILIPYAGAQRAAVSLTRSKAEAARLTARIATMARLPTADFGSLARAHSECPSGPRGGDLGRFTLDKMVPEFSAALRQLHPGQVSGAVETPFGYHLIRRH